VETSDRETLAATWSGICALDDTVVFVVGALKRLEMEGKPHALSMLVIGCMQPCLRKAG
jgi:hypothetical protein